MAIKVAQVSIENIDDTEGFESVMTALKNITGVTEIELQPENRMAFIHYDDTKTTVHAFVAAMPRKTHVIMIRDYSLLLF